MKYICPHCSPSCDSYDEHNKTCMHNTHLIEPEEAIVRAMESPAWDFEQCFEEMD